MLHPPWHLRDNSHSSRDSRRSLVRKMYTFTAFYQNNSPKVQVAVALRVKPPPHVPLPRALFCSFLMESSEKSKKIVSFTNQSDETSPSRTPVITSSPAGQQGGPCSSLIAGQSWLLHSPLSPLRPLEIAGPTLLLCSARWTPTGTL